MVSKLTQCRLGDQVPKSYTTQNGDRVTYQKGIKEISHSNIGISERDCKVVFEALIGKVLGKGKRSINQKDLIIALNKMENKYEKETLSDIFKTTLDEYVKKACFLPIGRRKQARLNKLTLATLLGKSGFRADIDKFNKEEAAATIKIQSWARGKLVRIESQTVQQIPQVVSRLKEQNIQKLSVFISSLEGQPFREFPITIHFNDWSEIDEFRDQRNPLPVCLEGKVTLDGDGDITFHGDLNFEQTQAFNKYLITDYLHGYIGGVKKIHFMAPDKDYGHTEAMHNSAGLTGATGPEPLRGVTLLGTPGKNLTVDLIATEPSCDDFVCFSVGRRADIKGELKIASMPGGMASNLDKLLVKMSEEFLEERCSGNLCMEYPDKSVSNSGQDLNERYPSPGRTKNFIFDFSKEFRKSITESEDLKGLLEDERNLIGRVLEKLEELLTAPFKCWKKSTGIKNNGIMNIRING